MKGFSLGRRISWFMDALGSGMCTVVSHVKTWVVLLKNESNWK